MVWVVAGGGAAVAGTAGAMWVVSASAGATGSISAWVTLVKILTSSLQVLGQLDFTLDLEWPGLFRWLVQHVARAFSFDLLGLLDRGCVTGYSFRTRSSPSRSR